MSAQNTKTGLFERVALIGIGLIGSSLARVLRRESPATAIVACARRAETLAAVRRLDLADETSDDPAAAVAGADLVVIATPLSAYAAIGRRIAPVLRAGAIVTDVGSVKGVVIRDLAPLLPPGVDLVPGHPVAGTEHSGPEAGFAELFRDRWCILTPPPGTAPEAVARITALWELAGMRVVTDPEHHDKALDVPTPTFIADTDRRHRDHRQVEIRSHRVLRGRVPRLHPHRGVGPGNVARRLPRQPRGGARDAAAFQRGSDRAAACDPSGRRNRARKRFARTRAIRRSIIEAKQA